MKYENIPATIHVCSFTLVGLLLFKYGLRRYGDKSRTSCSCLNKLYQTRDRRLATNEVMATTILGSTPEENWGNDTHYVGRARVIHNKL